MLLSSFDAFQHNNPPTAAPHRVAVFLFMRTSCRFTTFREGSRLLRDSPTRSVSPKERGERLPPRGVLSQTFRLPLSAIIFLPEKFTFPLRKHKNHSKNTFFSVFSCTIQKKALPLCPKMTFQNYNFVYKLTF